MQPLIDGDFLLYEIGFAVEVGWEGENSPPFDYVIESVSNKIGNICALVDATVPPIIFFSSKRNFRTDIAKTTPYKQRASRKPYHYHNTKAYLKGKYECREHDGLEADDLMAIEQYARGDETIICTRDKDLRIVPGWHFGWELGSQPQYGPKVVSPFGRIELSPDRKSIKGEGLLFFYAQCLTGDPVDTVPGLGRVGAVGAFKILEGSVDEGDAFNRVREAYRASYGDVGDEKLLEQGRLLWMTKELKEDGNPVLWEFPVDGVENQKQQTMD